MYISNLSIKNYRSFENFDVKLKPFTQIIGENNIGKSNMLDSLGLIYSQEISSCVRSPAPAPAAVVKEL